jgi:O-antigen/teichoic acid export membrane protein
MDQCVSSASNFAVAVVVARVAGVAGLGEFSLAYAAWLVLAATHRSLITDPMAIENDVNQPDAKARIRAGLASELTLGLAAAATFAVVGTLLTLGNQRGFGVSFIALAPWLPFLLAQDYWRWVGFMKAAPGQALANDLVFDAMQAVAFVSLIAVSLHSAAVAIGAWGLGAAAGAVYGLFQHSIRPTLSGGIDRIRRRWAMSKWLVMSSTTGWGASQSYSVLTAAFLGPVGLGGLKAAQGLVSGPSLVLLQAGGSISLPEASKGLAERGWPGLRRVARLTTAAGIASVGFIGIVVLMFGRRLMVLLYGPEFGKYSHVALLLAVAYFFTTFSLGAILSLKTTRQTRVLFRVTLITLVVSLASVAILASTFGVQGAAEAAIVSGIAASSAQLMVHFRSSRREAERLQSESQSAGEGPDAGESGSDGSAPTRGPAPDDDLVASVDGFDEWRLDSDAPLRALEST